MTSTEPSNVPLPRHEMGKLHHGLASAPDTQIAQVVAMVDALEQRGAADDVIAPLRPRLALLRPRRPLRFCRLLFMPLDPLIVPAAQWQPDHATIPRTALQPLSDMVHAELAHEADAIHVMIRGHAVGDADIALAAGRRLWPAAAAILAAAQQPPRGWAHTELPAGVATKLMRDIGAMLTQTEKLQDLFAEVEIGVVLRPELLAPLLSAAADTSDRLVMMVALVLARIPQAHKVLVQAGRAVGQHGEAHVRAALERAGEMLLCRLESTTGVEALVVGSGLGQAGAEVRQIVQFLDCVRPGPGYSAQPERVANIARRLDASCRLRFGAAIRGEFAEALHRLREDAAPAALSRLEDLARGLHNLKQEARRIGSPELYDTLLLQAAALVKTTDARSGLGLIDRVRLVEILAGPDDALAMLEPLENEGAEPA